MAIINQGILGGISGTVGTVVGSSWKGIDYIRAKATSYNDANSTGQIATRGAFSKIVKIAKSLMASVIRPIWDPKANKMSGFNYFFKTNFPFIDSMLEVAQCEGLKISIGELPLPSNLAIVNNVAVPGGVTVSWVDNSGTFGAEPNDRLRIVAIRGDEAVAIDPAGITRGDESAEVVLPFGSNVDVRVFAFFDNVTNKSFSNDINFLVHVS